ncbi:MAG: FHA domain-containing protein [Microbacterium sp. 71-36]|uniref:FHA domain-containing protein FhaB/FipA n=1 Tax=unclassified Microbacterium TaxID=2609290 RepID=UPI00086DB932|nr:MULTISPECIES: FHA domain-containing protein [unclassified Microbacterium]MBN9211280.1 FHA domain-containing protein [Microbacterium sp.]ODT41745.1 MAG: FHA domain-containing protein [Microbacterium sp. SCN 71-17]OJV75342.1 MAG: FHA domain-containing protein [Microbacterium sp. 71-36]
MSPLTLLLLQGGFLVLLWFFVFGVVYSLRADLFGVKVRKLPEPAAPAAAPAAPAPTSSPNAETTQVKRPAAPVVPPVGGLATTASVSRIVITSGPKAGLELPLGTEPLTIGRSSESGLVIRDDYTSSHHARLVLWGDQWMLQDLDSTNGTTHDGARVASPVQVKVGAPIKVGATTFELRK